MSLPLALWLERHSLASLANASQEWSVLNDPHMDYMLCELSIDNFKFQSGYTII